MFTVQFEIKLSIETAHGDGSCDVVYLAYRWFDSLDDAIAFKDAIERGHDGTRLECHAIIGDDAVIWCRRGHSSRPDVYDPKGWNPVALKDARKSDRV